MSMYDALYGREGHGVRPDEPEKKGFARFCQIVGRDLAQLLGTNLMVCLLCLPAALTVSLGISLLSLPLTLVLSLLSGLLTGPAMLLLSDGMLRSLQDDPSPWLPRAGETLRRCGKSAAGLGAAAMLVFGLCCFVSDYLFETAVQQQVFPNPAVVLFLLMDFFLFALAATLSFACLPANAADASERAGAFRLRRLPAEMLQLLQIAPARCLAAALLMLLAVGAMIQLFPVSIFWTILFGFWLPALIAMQILFPAIRNVTGCRRYTVPADAGSTAATAAAAMTKQQRFSNWWYYHWGLVTVAVVLFLGVVYVGHSLLTTVDPDVQVAVVTSEALPEDAVRALQLVFRDYAEDVNQDGQVLVQINNYTWSQNAAETDPSSQMAGAVRMNTDLADGDSAIWILEDPEGFEEAYGALHEKLGSDWEDRLISWDAQPVLSAITIYDGTDSSTSTDLQRLLSDCRIAVFDETNPLWEALNRD